MIFDLKIKILKRFIQQWFCKLRIFSIKSVRLTPISLPKINITFPWNWKKRKYTFIFKQKKFQYHLRWISTHETKSKYTDTAFCQSLIAVSLFFIDFRYIENIKSRKKAYSMRVCSFLFSRFELNSRKMNWNER